MLTRHVTLVAGILGVMVWSSGCHRPAAEGQAEGQVEATTAAETATGHTHGAWWCDEHGVPEEVCGLCSKKAADEMKAKGDWCKQHDRPDSQCFVCHPEYEAQFAAQYEAKYGKKPPKPNTDG